MMKINSRYEIKTVVAEINQSGDIGNVYDDFTRLDKKTEGSFQFGFVVVETSTGRIPSGCKEWHDKPEDALNEINALEKSDRFSTNPQSLVDKVVCAFQMKHPSYDKAEFIRIAEHGDLGVVRQLATAFTYYKNVKWQERQCVIDALNRRVNALLGEDMAALFDHLVMSQQTKLLDGDKRYTMLVIGKPDIYVKHVLKSMVYLKEEYIGKNTQISDLKKMMDIYMNGIKPHGVFKDSDMSIEGWVKLTEYILIGKFDQAYAFMKQK